MNIKESGDSILEKVRNDVKRFSNNNPDRWFKINRWIYSRLQLDERKTKQNIKIKMIKERPYCGHCGKKFADTRFIDIHRVDKNKGYSEMNCMLVHNGECHREIETQSNYGRMYGQKIMVKQSKRYKDYGVTLYWWDITDNESFKCIKERNGIIVFQEKDTKVKHIYHYQDLVDLFTPERKTSRNHGNNWGVRVLKDRPDKLAFEPGVVDKKWRFIKLNTDKEK